MAKGIILLLSILLALSSANGQDLITRTDGVVLKAKNLEITPSLVRFRLFGSADSLVYQISLGDVKTIQLADGSVQTFTATSSPLQRQEKQASFNYEADFGRNIFYYHPLDLIYNNLTFAYERIFTSGKVGLKIPVTFGLAGNSDQYYDSFRENVVFGTGVELKVYPNGQGKFRYFLAPALHFSSFNDAYYTYNGFYDKRKASMFTAALKVGGYYQFSKAFLFSADLGFGYRFFNLPGNSYEYYAYENKAYVPANLHIGFRF